MPLRLHSSSCCDVCLDAYTLDSADKAPSAIPCGHVFCKECLTSVQPANCPLCRKPFLSDRIKRLHIDIDASNESRDMSLLKELLMLWGEKDPDGKSQFTLLFEETQGLINGREDESPALKQAMDMMSKYILLKERRKQDHQTIKRFESQLREQDIQVAQYKDVSQDMERSLMKQVSTLQSQLSKTQDEVRRLRVEASSTNSVEVMTLRVRLDKYETELDELRPMVKKANEYEQEINRLRLELSEFSHPVYSFNRNPLPPPPMIRPFDGLPTLAEALATNTNATLFSTSYVNGNAVPTSQTNGQTPSVHSNGSSTNTPKQKYDKKSKGKEREHGPSYKLSASPQSINLQTPKAQNGGLIVPGAYTQHRVIPKSPPPRSPPLPPLPPKSNGIKSTAQPAQVEQKPYVDPYTLTAAYVSEFAKGYSTGYQLAEYTSGTEAAVVDDTQIQSNHSRATSGNTQSYSQNQNNDRYSEKGNKTPRSTTSVHSAMINTPTGRSTVSLMHETESQDGSYTMNTPETSVMNNHRYHVSSSDVEVGSLSSNNTRSQGHRRSNKQFIHSINTPSDRSTMALMSNTASQDNYTINSSHTSAKTEESNFHGYASDASTVSLLSNSTHSQGHRRSNSQVIDPYQVGRGLPSTLASNTNATRPRNERHISMPIPRQPTSNGVSNSIMITANTATATTRQSDSNSVHSSGTQETIQSWGTIPTMDSWPELASQSTGGSVGDLGLLNFQQTGEASRIENRNTELVSWDPVVHSTLLGQSNSNLNLTSGNVANGGTQGHSFPLRERESDDERTPMSGANRSLVSVASTTSSFPRLETLNIHGRPRQHDQERERERDRDRNRDRERERERERERRDARSRERGERRRSTYPSSSSQIVTAGSEPGTRQTQMMTVSDYTSAQQSRVPHTADARYSNSQSSQHWLDHDTSSIYSHPVPSHTSISNSNRSHGHSSTQAQSQSNSRRDAPARRLSMSTAAAETSAPNTAPESTSWTEMGYYTDGPSRATYSSPTVFDSSSGSNALGLDGLNDPRPLQISAPRPIPSSRNFLRSFSYDTYS